MDNEMKKAFADWDKYATTPYAPYLSFVDFVGWTVEQYNLWLRTGDKPEGWTWEVP